MQVTACQDKSMEPRLHTLDSFPPPMEVIKDDMYYENAAPPEYSTFNNNNLGEIFLLGEGTSVLSP